MIAVSVLKYMVRVSGSEDGRDNGNYDDLPIVIYPWRNPRGPPQITRKRLHCAPKTW